MPLNPDVVGLESQPVECRWSSTDCLLYALGVGAGVDELQFTTENSIGLQQKVLPTMPVVLGVGGPIDKIGTFDWAMLVHGEQAIELYGDLPVEGHILATGKIAGMYDKGKAAVVVVETTAVDFDTRQPLFKTTASLFIRGEGGWGGDRGPSGPRNVAPGREPSHVVTYQTTSDQALIYRLSGDRNPLHSDPEFAKLSGFDRPILHGLCTYGFTGRALLHSLCSSDPSRFKSMEARFSSPVYPGDVLTVKMWVDGNEAIFQTVRSDGIVVTDGGRCVFS